MSPKVKSMVLEGPRKISMRQFDMPSTGPEDALLKVEMCGVCGSDVSMYNGKLQVPYPIIMGHEIVGYIEEIGDLFAERHQLKRGDRVVVEFTFGCGFCDQCLLGEYSSCVKRYTYGCTISCNQPPHLWGAYGEYLYLPPRAMVHKISPGVPAEAAVLTCAIMGNAIRWLRTVGQVTIGDTVVIEGPGQQGLAAVIAAGESGATNIIVAGRGDNDRTRLAMAKKLGAHHIIDIEKENLLDKVNQITEGRLADVVVDVTGKPAGLAAALDLARKRGTIVAPGMYGTNTEVPLLADKLIRKEISLKGVYSHDARSVKQAIKIVESGKYPLDELVTHKFPLKEADTAVRTAGGEIPGENPIKTVIIP